MNRSPFDDGPPSTATRAGLGLAKLGLALRAESWRGAHSRGLTPTQGQILALLLDRTGMTVNEVATEIGVTAPTVSDAVSTLVAKRLVRKARAAVDGRRVVLTLTAAGRREAGRSAAWPDVLAGAVRTLPEADQAAFLRGLLRMLRQLQIEGRIPVAHMCVGCRFFVPHAYADADRPHHCHFVDAPFGDRHLRVDCGDWQAAADADEPRAWARFTSNEHDTTGGRR